MTELDNGVTRSLIRERIHFWEMLCMPRDHQPLFELYGMLEQLTEMKGEKQVEEYPSQKDDNVV